MFETPLMNVPSSDESSVIPREYRQANVVFQFAPMIFNEEGIHVVEYEFPGCPPYRTQFFVAADPALAIPQATPLATPQLGH
jgi:hypothetical protein